jgi:F-type H+-transporting ATPase subunit b
VRSIHGWAAIVLVAGACLFGRIARADSAPESVDRGHHTPAAAPEPEPRFYQGGRGSPVQEVPKLDPKKLALQLLNFGVLLFVLIKFGGPAIGKALVARHEQLKAELAAAAEARTAALARLDEQERRLAALEQEILAIRNGVKQEAEAEKARLIALAEERARRIRSETTFALEQQIKEAEVRLRHEAGLAAVDLAEQMVRRSLDARDQQRFVDAFVGSSAGSPAGAAGPSRSGN